MRSSLRAPAPPITQPTGRIALGVHMRANYAELVMHVVGQFCFEHSIALTSVSALVLVEICVYAAAFILFLLIERPFLQLRHRLAPRRANFTLNK